MTAIHTEEQIRHSVEVLAREWHAIMNGDFSDEKFEVESASKP